MITYFFNISQNPPGYDKVLVRNLSDTGAVDFIAWISVSPRYQRHLTYVKANERSYRDLGNGQIDIQAFAGFRGNAPSHALSLRRRARSKCCKGKRLTVNWRLMGGLTCMPRYEMLRAAARQARENGHKTGYFSARDHTPSPFSAGGWSRKYCNRATNNFEGASAGSISKQAAKSACAGSQSRFR